MADFTLRSRAVWGDGVDRLAHAHVAVAGLGGVGCMAAEALCRAGVGPLTLIDDDVYETTNLNRQLFATHGSLGQPKAQVAAERMADINPHCRINAVQRRITAESLPDLLSAPPDFVADAIDTVTSKLALAEYCLGRGIGLISCMGAGNRSNPTAVRVGDIADTAGSGCALSKVMRKELRARGIGSLPVVYSVEQPVSAVVPGSVPGRHSPGSTPMVPPAAGLALAYYIVTQIMG